MIVSDNGEGKIIGFAVKGGLDAERGRPQLRRGPLGPSAEQVDRLATKPKVCEFVLFCVGGRGRVLRGFAYNPILLIFVFSWIAGWTRNADDLSRANL